MGGAGAPDSDDATDTDDTGENGMRIATIVLAMLATAGTAQAASFDCARAQTALETAICASPALSRNDEILAKAYATALGGLSEEARGAMQSDQRAWLDYVPKSCSDDAAVPARFSEDQSACLASAFSSRIKTLEQSRMSGGWRFYVRERSAVLDDPDPDWWGGVATKHFASPRIDDTVQAALAFNAMMDETDSSLDTMFDDNGRLVDTEATSDTSIDVTVTAVTPHLISMSVDSYWMGHGAAHGNYALSTLHYLVDENRQLEAEDVFSGAGWEDKLGDLVLAELDRTIDGGIWEEARATVPQAAADPTRWSFADTGLVVQFQPYEVTAYAAGAPTVTIPWSALTDLLSEGYEEKVLY